MPALPEVVEAVEVEDLGEESLVVVPAEPVEELWAFEGVELALLLEGWEAAEDDDEGEAAAVPLPDEEPLVAGVEEPEVAPAAEEPELAVLLVPLPPTKAQLKRGVQT